MTTRGQGFCFHISCEKQPCQNAAPLKYSSLSSLKIFSSSGRGICTLSPSWAIWFCLLHCPDSCNCTARWRHAPVHGLAENTGVNLMFAVGRAEEDDGWARRQGDCGWCCFWNQNSPQWAHAQHETISLDLQHSLELWQTLLCSILTKISCGKHGKSEWQLPKQPGIPEITSFDGNQRTPWEV